MKRRQIVTIFCFLAYAIVFAHSVIPHSHHCLGIIDHDEHEEHAGHIHDFGHCEGLNTFVISSLNIQTSASITSLLHSESIAYIALNIENHSHKICFDLESHFRDHSVHFYRDHCTRAP